MYHDQIVPYGIRSKELISTAPRARPVVMYPILYRCLFLSSLISDFEFFLPLEQMNDDALSLVETRKPQNGHSQPSHHRLNRGWSRASSLMTEAEALGRVRGVRGIQHQDQYYQDQHGATAAAVAAACESRGRFRSVPASPLESESATSHSQSSDGRSSSRVEEKFSSDVVSRVGGFMSRRSGSRSLGAQGGAAGAEAASYPSHTTHGQIGYPSSEARENGNISLNLSVSEFNDLSFLAQVHS